MEQEYSCMVEEADGEDIESVKVTSAGEENIFWQSRNMVRI